MGQMSGCVDLLRSGLEYYVSFIFTTNPSTIYLPPHVFHRALATAPLPIPHDSQTFMIGLPSALPPPASHRCDPQVPFNLLLQLVKPEVSSTLDDRCRTPRLNIMTPSPGVVQHSVRYALSLRKLFVVWYEL
jgi:hypothetical protein